MNEIYSLNYIMGSNLDDRTVASFGDEWSRFDQQAMSSREAQRRFLEYFEIFPWHDLPSDAEGFDMGCGSGRWHVLCPPELAVSTALNPLSEL